MNALRWLFKDRTTGRIVIAQMPNAAMWIALVALAVSLAVSEGRKAAVATAVWRAALAVWAVDEVARGVNPWRRLLGAGTLIVLTYWLIAALPEQRA